MAEKITRRLTITPRRPNMNRTVHTYQIKTLSQYPLLIGEILRRAEQRRFRRAKWWALCRKLYGLTRLATMKNRVSAPDNSHRLCPTCSARFVFVRFPGALSERGENEEGSF